MSFWRKKWFWFLVIVIGAGWWWYAGRNKNQEQFVIASVERGDVVQTVSVSATLISDAEIDLNFETAGRLQALRVKEGDKVAEGDVLAGLRSSILDQEVEKARADLDRAEAEAGTTDDELREARTVVENAEDILKETEDAEDQKVSAADKTYDNTKEYESDAKEYYDQVVTEDGASSATAKSAFMTYRRAVNDKNEAEEAKSTARHNRDIALRSAKNDLRLAKEKVKTLESKHRDTIDNSAVRVARSNYQIALENVEKTQLKAPVNGTVTKLNYDRGEVIGTASTQSFGRLLSSDLLLDADIPESDVAKVKLGQKAKVTFDALGQDESFEASVVEIEPESTVIQDVVYYKAKLRLTNIDQRLKPGMSADADIETATKNNALWMPSRAVRQEGGNRFVEILGSDGISVERRDVKTGLEGDEGRTEVLSGVREGETLVVERTQK